MLAGDGYKGHKIGSRAEWLHQEFDRYGKDAAERLAERLKLKPSTVKSWLSAFSRGFADAHIYGTGILV
jgi:hypothetical protein